MKASTASANRGSEVSCYHNQATTGISCVFLGRTCSVDAETP